MKKFREALGTFADLLQVAGTDWRSFMPYFVSGCVFLIGWLKGVSPYWLAFGLPVVFCAMVFVGVLVRIWRLLGETPPKLGLPPYLAQNEYVDAAITKERHDANLKQFQVWAQLELAERELKSLRRRQSKIPAVQFASDEETILDRIEDLTDEKSMVDARCYAAEQRFMSDLNNKLRDGSLIAVGFVQPTAHGRPPVDIPALEWEFLKFDDNMVIAEGDGISYRVISIRTKNA